MKFNKVSRKCGECGLRAGHYFGLCLLCMRALAKKAADKVTAQRRGDEKKIK